MSTESWQAIANDPDVKPLLYETVQHPDGRQTERMRPYMRKHQRTEHEREIAAMDRMLSDPAEVKRLQNPGALKQQNDRRKFLLHRQSPPPLTAAQRDKLATLERASLDDAREGMLSQEELRHKPPGAVDRQREWERAKKPAVLTWKAARVLLHPESDAQDLANIERHRPAIPTRNLHVESLIPAQFALSPEAKANYDEINWHDPAWQAKAMAELKAAGVKINLKAKPADIRRAPRRSAGGDAKVYECTPCERIFSGGFGRRNWERHKAKFHNEAPSGAESTTTVPIAS